MVLAVDLFFFVEHWGKDAPQLVSGLAVALSHESDNVLFAVVWAIRHAELPSTVLMHNLASSF
jgi:hypothetical protein